MTTYQKREHFIRTAPNQFKKLNQLIKEGEYRQADALINEWNDPDCIAYAVTLLCDELVNKENEMNGHSVDEY